MNALWIDLNQKRGRCELKALITNSKSAFLVASKGKQFSFLGEEESMFFTARNLLDLHVYWNWLGDALLLFTLLSDLTIMV